MLETFAQAIGLAFPWFLLVIMVMGLLALIVPIFPGNVVIWACTLIYGLLYGFDGRAWLFFILITILTIVATLADNVLMGAKAHQAGAAWWSIAIALVSAFVTSLLLTPLVGLLAAPASLFISEYIRLHWDAKEAWKVTSGLLVGWGWAFVARFSLGTIAIILYSVWFMGSNG